ncbi:MAG: hypothetical protein JEZ04_08770 [Spirochaetales bacterium]|nr:hypothetical protein [Spirochaetales bacterium]
MTDDEKKKKKERDAELQAEIGAEIESEIEDAIERKFGGGGCDGEPWWDERSLPVKIVMGFGLGVLGLGLGALCIWLVMLLWNWLMPEIFGLTTLTYWKAGGLMLLSCILFKNIRFGNDSGRTERKRKKELRRYMSDDLAENGEV